MARTAVIAGTATAVSGAVAGSQQQKAQQKAAAQQAQADAAAQQAQADAAAQQAQIDAAAQQAVAQHVAAQATTATPDAAPAAAAGGDVIAQLQKLGELHQAGILNDEEFAAAKAKVLAG
jgi:hypothetical protein